VSTSAQVSIGVLDVDGLHLADKPLVPIRGAIRHVGDLYNGARRHGLTQLWLTDAWVRTTELPDTLAVAGQFRELRHAFVSDGLDDLHAFPTALTPWLDLRKKGEAGSGVSIVFPLYDEHAVWGLDTDGATLLGGLLAYAQAVGAPYYRSPGRTGIDLLQELGKRGAGSQREYPERLPAPAGQADTVTEVSWLRTLSPAERAKAYLHSYDKNAQWLSAAGVVELGLSGIEERHDPAGKVSFDKKLPGYWLAKIAGAEERWACTPTVAWALERGQAVAITEAYVWTKHSRAMETWYERLRTARTALYADTTAIPARLAPPRHRAGQREHVAGAAQDGRGRLYARGRAQGRGVPRERRARPGESVPAVGHVGDRLGAFQGAGRGDPVGHGAASLRRRGGWRARDAAAALEAVARG